MKHGLIDLALGKVGIHAKNSLQSNQVIFQIFAWGSTRGANLPPRVQFGRSLLVAVVGSEITGSRSGQAAGLVAPRSRFNFNHIGTEVGEDKAAGGAHHHMAEFDYPDTIERARSTGQVVLLSPA